MELKNPIKKRDAVYCNLKLFLIFLVIYGHMIEGRIYEDTVLMLVYRMIYSFHMPLFLFLSGLFLTDSAGCFRQMKKMLFLYCLLQPFAVFVCNLSGDHFSLWIPVWHLWYLLSLACMDLAGLLWYWFAEKLRTAWNTSFAKTGIVILSLLISCGAGYVPALGRFLSLSRTLCFLPYFFLGLFLPKDMDWKGFRRIGLAAFWVFLILFNLWGSRIPADFFYQADCFSASGIGSLGLRGFFYRLLSFFLACSIGLFFLVFTADCRLPISRLGMDTLVPFLLHAPMVSAMIRLAAFFPRMSGGCWNLFSIAVSIYLIFIFYKVTQWKQQMCRVTAKSAVRETMGLKRKKNHGISLRQSLGL